MERFVHFQQAYEMESTFQIVILTPQRRSIRLERKVKKEEVGIQKVLGTENPADAFTTYLYQQVMQTALAKTGLEFRDGRARAALSTAGSSHLPAGGDGSAL